MTVRSNRTGSNFGGCLHFDQTYPKHTRNTYWISNSTLPRLPLLSTHPPKFPLYNVFRRFSEAPIDTLPRGRGDGGGIKLSVRDDRYFSCVRRGSRFQKCPKKTQALWKIDHLGQKLATAAQNLGEIGVFWRILVCALVQPPKSHPTCWVWERGRRKSQRKPCSWCTKIKQNTTPNKWRFRNQYPLKTCKLTRPGIHILRKHLRFEGPGFQGCVRTWCTKQAAIIHWWLVKPRNRS